MMDRPLFRKTGSMDVDCGQMFRNHALMDSISALLSLCPHRRGRQHRRRCPRTRPVRLGGRQAHCPPRTRSGRVFSSALPAACTSPTRRTAAARCRRALDELSEAQADLAQRQHAPSGLLRIGLPTIGYRFLLPVLPGFQQRYPQVQLELDFNDRIVDVVSEGLDAVIRSGELADSSLTARRLGAFASSLCGAGYLQAHGTPGDVGDLGRHAALRFRYPTTGKLHPWQMPGIEGDAGARLPGDDLQQHGSRAGRCDRLHGPGLDARLPRR